MAPEPTAGPQVPVAAQVLSTIPSTPTTTTTTATTATPTSEAIQIEDINSASHNKVNGTLPDTPMQVDQEEPRIPSPSTKDLLATIKNGINTPAENEPALSTETIETVSQEMATPSDHPSSPKDIDMAGPEDGQVKAVQDTEAESMDVDSTVPTAPTASATDPPVQEAQEVSEAQEVKEVKEMKEEQELQEMKEEQKLQEVQKEQEMQKVPEVQEAQYKKVPIPSNPLGSDFPDVEDVSDDENVPKSFLASGVFRPQLDDIILDDDLLDFYERLKFLISLSPLKTAQVLYAFSSATDHLNLELELRRSVLDLNSKAFTFYQENTWFTVDLDPPGENEDEDESRFRILPARHKLFPAFQKRHREPEYTYYLPQHYYYPYPFPHDSKYPYPTSAPPDRASSPGVLQPPAEIDADRRERRRERERDRTSRKERHGKSSKRRHSRDSETSSRDHRHRAHDSRDLQEYKRSRPDPDSPSFTGYEASHKHRRSEHDRSAMEPPSPRNSSHRDRERDRERERERDRDRDSSTLDGRDPNSAERLERRLARKQLGHSGKSRHHRVREIDAPSDHERSNASERVEDGGTSLKIRMTFPAKPTPQAQGTTQGPQPTSGTKEMDRGPTESVDTPMTGSTTSMPTPPMGAHRSILPSEPQASSETGAQVNDYPHQQQQQQQQQQQPQSHVLTIQPTTGHRKNRNNQASDAQTGLYGDEMLKKGTWTASEEAILTQAVRELSVENWHAIAMRVPGRNAKQCMQKWQTDLDPQINRLPWSVDEDERLVEAYHTFGNSWQQIAKMVETRTWYQCYNRVRAKSVKTRILLTQYEHPQSLATVGRQGKGTSATPTPSTPVSAAPASAPGPDQTPNPNSSAPSNDGPEKSRGDNSVKMEQMEERISSQSSAQYSSSLDRMSEQRQPKTQPPQPTQLPPQQPPSQPVHHHQQPQHQPIQHAQQQAASAPRPPAQPAQATQSTPPVQHIHLVQAVQPVQSQHLPQAQPQSQPQSQNSVLPSQSQQALPRPSPILHAKQEDARESSGAQPPQV
ncbi:DNA binding transcription coactivator transcription factor [Podila clonocystis]|nr:DNA binding transcription coactivator transcription factor [Podila clonocystis]